jgi:hypothetical protein
MATKKQEETKVRMNEQSPLRWPDGQERTLIDRRRSKNGWKKTFRQYTERLTQQLQKLGMAEATISFNQSPMDRQDPGVALYFSAPQREDYSWQAALGIDSPMPTEEQIEKAFKAKAMKHHPDMVKQSGGDVKLWYLYDEHKKKALAWVKGTYKADREYVIACDRCTEPRWNLEAIRKILIAAATMDEYGNPGTLERTFKGFRVALPAHASTEENDVKQTATA